ncbi:hypothetical protein ELP33_22205 [Klebsiella quasipneumoniae]|nr:hypothetical protein [Klebsiella quasipneumoniae]MBM5563053.1 hypothetical protein [Klebsiella quasipneumoniae]
MADILVSSEVSHRIATMVSRHVVHTDNADLHIPATRWAMYQGAPGPLSTHVPYAGCFHTWKRTPPSE